MIFYSGLVHYFAALNAVDQDKFGEAIGFVQSAEAKLNECSKMKSTLKEAQETLKFATELIEAKLF